MKNYGWLFIIAVCFSYSFAGCCHENVEEVVQHFVDCIDLEVPCPAELYLMSESLDEESYRMFVDYVHRMILSKKIVPKMIAFDDEDDSSSDEEELREPYFFQVDDEDEGTMCAYDQYGALLGRIVVGRGAITKFVYSREGYLLVGLDSGEIVSIYIPRWEIYKRYQAHEASIVAIEMLDPLHFVAGDRDGVVSVWSILSDEPIHIFDHLGQPVVCISVVAEDLIAVHTGSAIYIWDILVGVMLYHIDTGRLRIARIDSPRPGIIRAHGNQNWSAAWVIPQFQYAQLDLLSLLLMMKLEDLTSASHKDISYMHKDWDMVYRRLPEKTQGLYQKIIAQP